MLAGFTTGSGADAAARREGEAGVAASRGAAPGIGGMSLGGRGRSAFDERADLLSEAVAAALSSGAGLGGEISRALPAL